MTPYFPNLNPCGDFVTDIVKATFRDTQSNNYDKILLAAFCSVGEKMSGTFVSNFLCWLQVVFGTSGALQMVLRTWLLSILENY